MDPEDPRQRRRGHLDLVHPRQQRVDGTDQLLGIQSGGGDGPHRQTAVDVQEATEEDGQHQRDDIADLAGPEEHRPESERRALPADPLLDVPVGLGDARRSEAEGFDGAPGGHALLDVAVDPGVGRHLPLVGTAGAAQVPARPDGQDRDARHQGEPENGCRPQQRGDGQNGGDARHEELRKPRPHRVGEVVDVGRRPGEQVTGAGPLHHPQREVEDPGDELLAQAGQHAFAENGAEPPAHPREHGLHHERPGEDDDGGVDPGRSSAPGRVVDDVLEHPRTDQSGRAGHGLQDEHGGDGATLLAKQPAQVPPRRPTGGHGQDAGGVEGRGVVDRPAVVGGRRGRAHASPLVTSRRYRGSESSRSPCRPRART